MRIILSIVVFVSLIAPHDVAAQSAPTLTPVRGRVFRFQDGPQNGVVFVTPDALLVVDPLGVSAGRWLRGELETRFPGRTIAYLVYTSDVFERIAGASAFPKIPPIAHRAFNTELLNSRLLPVSLAALDVNRDGTLQPDEWTGTDAAPLLNAADANKDRSVTPREVRNIVPLPDRAFRDRLAITVGGIEVEIVNPGSAFATPALFFRDERVLYVGGHPAFAAEGFGFGAARVDEMAEWFRGISQLKFDTVITGSGEPMTRDEFDMVRRYGEDLTRTAINGYDRGWSRERTAAAAPMPQYSGRRVDARRSAVIGNVFDSARVSRIEIQGAAFARAMRPSRAYCEGYNPCGIPERIIGGSGALRMTKSTIGFVLEAAFAEQYISQREGVLEDEAFAQRASRGSLLFRVGRTRPSSFSIDLLMGPTFVFYDTVGLTRVKQAVAPRGGRHPFTERTTNMVGTVGIDVIAPFSRAVSLYLPVRATWLGAPSSVERRPDRLDVQAGVGFGIRLKQSIR
jgi:hypothetical protein